MSLFDAVITFLWAGGFGFVCFMFGGWISLVIGGLIDWALGLNLEIGILVVVYVGAIAGGIAGIIIALMIGAPTIEFDTR